MLDITPNDYLSDFYEEEDTLNKPPEQKGKRPILIEDSKDDEDLVLIQNKS